MYAPNSIYSSIVLHIVLGMKNAHLLLKHFGVSAYVLDMDLCSIDEHRQFVHMLHDHSGIKLI